MTYANNDELIQHCQRLRYQIYCLEMGHAHEMQHTDKREYDEFDPRAVHALVQHNATGSYIATVRLVLYDRNSPSSHFPVEELEILRRKDRDIVWQVPRYRIAEVSRFAVSKMFRRRVGERNTIHGICENFVTNYTEQDQRHYSEITINLIKAAFDLSYVHGITHWYALMEPSLIRLLARIGMVFTPVGPLVDYFGKRQPCIAKVQDLMDGILQERTDIWSYMSHGGRVRFDSIEAKYEIAI